MLTTDDRLLRKALKFQNILSIAVANPVTQADEHNVEQQLAALAQILPLLKSYPKVVLGDLILPIAELCNDNYLKEQQEIQT